MLRWYVSWTCRESRGCPSKGRGRGVEQRRLPVVVQFAQESAENPINANVRGTSERRHRCMLGMTCDRPHSIQWKYVFLLALFDQLWWVLCLFWCAGWLGWTNGLQRWPADYWHCIDRHWLCSARPAWNLYSCHRIHRMDWTHREHLNVHKMPHINSKPYTLTQAQSVISWWWNLQFSVGSLLPWADSIFF